MKLLAAGSALVLLCACASHADRFYELETRPLGTVQPRTSFAHQVMLSVSLPPLVDRAELVVNAGDRVALFEHERWGSSLLEQVNSTLGRDLEQRRPDVLASARRDPLGPPVTKIALDVTTVTAQRGGDVSIAVQWRISTQGDDRQSMGRQTFTSAAVTTDFSAIAAALSDCLGLLADRLIQELPPA